MTEYNHLAFTTAWAQAQSYKNIIEQTGEETVAELESVINKSAGTFCIAIDSTDSDFDESDSMYERMTYGVLLLETAKAKDKADRHRAVKAQKNAGREFVKHLYTRLRDQEWPTTDIPCAGISMTGVGPLGTGNLYGVMISIEVNEYLL